jgi:penicillin amidase
MAPVPGWERRFDWIGRIPFDALPSSYNPPAGALATANHKIAPDDYPYHLSFEWAEPYRIRRIHELLAAREKHSTDSFRRMQADVVSPMAREFLPILLGNAPDSERGRQALRLLAGWDGTMGRDRPEPLLFEAWYREVTRGLYADELGDRFEEAWGLRPLFVKAALTGDGSWCKDRAAGRDKSCRDVIAEALDRAWDEIDRRQGGDPRRWRWGEPHAAALRHLPFAHVPVLRTLFNLGVPTGGDTYTVDVGTMDIADPETPFANIHGPGYRAIYDLDDLDRSLFMQSTGQSGNPLSPLYSSFVKPWAEVDFVPMSTQAQDATAGALGTLTLLPL